MYPVLSLLLTLLSFLAAPAPIHITSCAPLSISGQYVLDQDITCSFPVNADHISVDLQGHTVTYSTAPAFSLCDTWFHGLPASACGNGHHNGFTLTNGTIRQALGSAQFNHAIWVGQGNGIAPGALTHLKIVIQEVGTQAIHFEYAQPGWLIRDNKIFNNVTNVQHPGQTPGSARSQFQGATMFWGGGQNVAGIGDTIINNIIIGTPQTGIFNVNQHTLIQKNAIYMTSFYSNDYCIASVFGDGQQILDNLCMGRGRGIDLETSGWTVDGNMIVVQEEANNSEYGGCELDGTDGIRLKNYTGNIPSTGWTLSNNIVFVKAGPCLANGLRLTHLTAVSGTITGNKFTTLAGTNADYPLSLSGTITTGITFTGNGFYGSSIQCDWDGCGITIDAGQDWELLGITIVDQDGHLATNYITIFDPIVNPTFSCTINSSAMLSIGQVTHQCP